MGTYSQISALNAEYWLRVDQQRDLPVAELYVPAGRFTAGSLDLSGREAISEFFQKRNRDQLAAGRLTRHVLTNLAIEETTADRIVCRSTVLVFAGIGDLPLEAAGPSTIADVEDVCVRAGDRAWLFESRLVIPIFVGPASANFVRS